MKKYIIFINDGMYDFMQSDVSLGYEVHTFHVETHTEAEIYFFRWLIENGH
jgi:hypothetical protein